EEGGHGGESGMVWRIVNFAILALALFLMLRYLKVKDFFADRKKSIIAELEEAKKAKEDAERKVKEFELKFSSLDKRLEEIYQEIREEGKIEKKRIIEEAIKLADRIQEQARLAAEQEIKKAKEEIKGEIAKVAVEMAEEILRGELSAADHERLIKEYLEKVRLH
ncbi:MAG: ATP synthase F0 subunit B, partial [Deltaproteobacteria bacterium]